MAGRAAGCRVGRQVPPPPVAGALDKCTARPVRLVEPKCRRLGRRLLRPSSDLAVGCCGAERGSAPRHFVEQKGVVSGDACMCIGGGGRESACQSARTGTGTERPRPHQKKPRPRGTSCRGDRSWLVPDPFLVLGVAPPARRGPRAVASQLS